MSSPAKKKENPDASAIFSINFDQVESTGMPGITQLINPEVLRQKAAAAAKKNSTPLPNPDATRIEVQLNENEQIPIHVAPSGVTSSESLNPPSLESLGVRIELEFNSDRGFYRYHRWKAHGKKILEPWQEMLFSQMKFDLKSMAYSGGFQEYEGSLFPFHQDAFGLKEGEFLQLVRGSDTAKTIHVLISDKTLVPRKTYLLEMFQEEKADEEQSFKIELA